MRVIYLTFSQVLDIHELVLEVGGGAHGARSISALEATLAAPQQSVFGTELYPSLYQKAACYAFGIIMSHPFFDGNKRTGISTAGIFLAANGIRLTVSQKELEDFAVAIVTEKNVIPQIAAWLEKNSSVRK